MKIEDILEDIPCNLCGTKDYSIIYESRYENQTAEDLKEKFKSLDNAIAYIEKNNLESKLQQEIWDLWNEIYETNDRKKRRR